MHIRESMQGGSREIKREKRVTMKPPVSVCHHVSEMGHLESPTTLKNHLHKKIGKPINKVPIQLIARIKLEILEFKPPGTRIDGLTHTSKDP